MNFGVVERNDFILLLTIFDMGGSGKVQDIYRHIKEREYKNLYDYDLEPMSDRSYEPRWQVHIAYCRLNLVKDACIEKFKKGYNKGVWTITEKGESLLRACLKSPFIAGRLDIS